MCTLTTFSGITFVAVLLHAILLADASATALKQQQQPQPSAVNCTWQWFDQPVDHFARGSVTGPSGTYKQRVCLYDKYFHEFKGTRKEQRPMFFYVGNEAPVEAYVNNTGLMWDLAPKYGALIVFAEHRYFGKSIPDLKAIPNCLAYLGSTQALADYAMVVQSLKTQYNMKDANKVISFGGSYGGMLATWFRFKYPNVNSGGAIAASAPIVGYPANNPALDGGWVAISRTASHKYDADIGGDDCHSAILSVWPLMVEIGKTSWGRSALRSRLATCEPVRDENDVGTLVDYVQQVFFLLAEGNFPFPTNYITYAILQTLAPMPAWPMKRVCDIMQKAKEVNHVHVQGNPSDVNFQVAAGETSTFNVKIDWRVSASDIESRGLQDPGVLAGLNMIEAMHEAIDVFYNVTNTLKCHPYRTNYLQSSKSPRVRGRGATVADTVDVTANLARELKSGLNEEHKTCTKESVDPLVAWSAIVCNEDQNAIQYSVRGVGNDMFWPPTPKARQYSVDEIVTGMLGYCKTFSQDHEGYAGVFPNADDYGKWPLQLYGGNETYQPAVGVKPAASRIAFSNGKFDPWSAAGVLPRDLSINEIDPMGISKLVISDGGHHADLFFPTPYDTESMKQVRRDEEFLIEQWAYHIDDELTD